MDLLEADREEPFDVVVLQPEDAVTPHLTQQRLLARCPRRAIALASGHSVERLRDMLDVDPAAFDRFVPKPFNPKALVAWLDSLETAATIGRPLPVMAEGVHGTRSVEAWTLVGLPTSN